MSNARVTRAADVPAEPSRRPGIRHRRLLGPESPSHHVVLVEADPGATVELHGITTNETLYVLEGRFELLLPEGDRPLLPGDLAHFPSGTTHGLVCRAGPGRFLAIFAPPKPGA